MSACRSTNLAIALAVLLAAAGCATTSEQLGETGEIVIVVQNDRWERATIYTTPQFGNRRLGVVEGNSVAQFKLDWALPRIQIMAEVQGGGTIRWSATVVRPGEIWTFTICRTRQRHCLSSGVRRVAQPVQDPRRHRAERPPGLGAF